MHRDELAGTLVDNQVIWDLTPGSYHRQTEVTLTDRLQKLLQRQKIILPPPDKLGLIDCSWRASPHIGRPLPPVVLQL